MLRIFTMSKSMLERIPTEFEVPYYCNMLTGGWIGTEAQAYEAGFIMNLSTGNLEIQREKIMYLYEIQHPMIFWSSVAIQSFTSSEPQKPASFGQNSAFY